ncbi:glycosyltransferase family 1 protein [Cytobacillus oceanisediminis]|uniref:glycosyltransferase family 4 protein n=1 Tax=Cytobacillus oceanisediminis TaxID=665099 RepID=UPI00203BF256|nr:glycosyltransferase family 1 protein [Cytobacillus oceanisediminis]MCM3246606.1 glycosyltransferase family 1 protein [Cytobacillus oceanisediminis]
MKIAFFTDTFYPDINGVAKTLKRFTDYLSDQKITLKIFAPSSQSDEYVSSHIRRFKSASFFLYPECRVAFPNYFHIKEELEKFNPDLIHVATPFNLGLSGLYCAKKLNIPIVGSYHTDFDYYLEFYDLKFLSNILWKYMTWFHSTFKKVFVPSSETLQQLRLHGFSNLELWPRGVDCKLFHPYCDKLSVRRQYSISKKYLLTYAGRLAPEKNVDILPDIAQLLPPHFEEDIHWLIVGDGPLRKQLQEAAPKNMTFTGYLAAQQLAEVYSASDLFVFPSPTETFGNVVLESMASGTPVIGANAGGVKSIIQNGVTGYLCEPGNAEDFAASIINLLKNHKVRSRMGFDGRDYALKQKWDEIFDNLIGQYKAVIGESGEKKKNDLNPFQSEFTEDYLCRNNYRVPIMQQKLELNRKNITTSKK